MSLRKLKKTLIIFVSISFFSISVWYLVNTFDWKQVFSAFGQIDFIRLISTIWLIQFVYILVRTWRWYLVISHSNPEIRFFDLYWITAIIVSLSVLTPAQLGETLKIELLSRRGLMARLPGLGSFVVERVMDLFVISAFGVLGLLFRSSLPNLFSGLENIIIILFFVALTTIFFFIRFNYSGLFSNWVGQLRTGVGSLKSLPMILFATILAWGITCVGWKFCLETIGLYTSLIEIFWMMAAITMGSLLSFIPGGLGISEILTVGILVALGYSDFAAQKGALILRFLAFIIFAFGIFHLLLFIVFKISDSRFKKSYHLKLF